MYRKEGIVIIDDNDEDVTPLPLVFSGFDTEKKEEEDVIIDSFQDLEQVVRTTTESYLAPLPEDNSPSPTPSTPTPSTKSQTQDDAAAEHDGVINETADADGQEEEDDVDDTASTPPPRIPTPILQALQAIRHYKPPPEPKTTFFLTETPTFWLLSLPSKCLEWGTPEATESRLQDGHYFWLTYDDGRLRHRFSAEAQTPIRLTKQKKTQTMSVQNTSVKLFATEWDLYDTFRKVNIARRLAAPGPRPTTSRPTTVSPAAVSPSSTPVRVGSSSTSTMAPVTTTSPQQQPQVQPQGQKTLGSGWARLVAARAREAVHKTTIIRIGDQPLSPRRRLLKSSKDLMESREFRLAATICERLLASGSYKRRQEIFLGQPRLVARQKPTEFRYIVTRLFDMYNSDTLGSAVTGLAWNGKDRTILAVGYGCYLLGEDVRRGLVCCWSIKNPFQPERLYHLDSAVTAVSFSSERPSLLAVGVMAGDVYVIDVSLYAGDPRAVRRLSPCSAYAPLWDVHWFFYTDFVTRTEEILTVGGDGWVCKWNLDKAWESYPLTRIQYYPDRDKEATILLTASVCAPRVLSGLCVTLLPDCRGRYLVGTKEGVVAGCRVNQRSARIGLSLAHAGAVYAIERSPFCANLYITAGADWTLCLWLCGFDEALLRFTSPLSTAMEGAAWSPSHATLIATASGRELQVWDIARRATRPVAQVRNEHGIDFTRVGWSHCGLSVMAGDRSGHVWVYHLSDLPHAAKLPRETLYATLAPLVPTQRRAVLREKLFCDD